MPRSDPLPVYRDIQLDCTITTSQQWVRSLSTCSVIALGKNYEDMATFHITNSYVGTSNILVYSMPKQINCKNKKQLGNIRGKSKYNQWILSVSVSWL